MMLRVRTPEGPATEKGPEKNEKREKSAWAYMNLGAVFAVTVGLFVLLGWWLDGKYGWAPWGTVGCGLLGVTAAMYHFLKETL